MSAMPDRQQALAAALGSVRLEDAEPSPEMLALGERWARGEFTTAELKEAAQRAAAGQPVDTPRPPRPIRQRPPAPGMPDDPYVYPGTNVLRNRFGVRDGSELGAPRA